MEGIPRKTRKGYKRTQIVFDMGELIRYVILREGFTAMEGSEFIPDGPG
jgi:hypothetical protein